MSTLSQTAPSRYVLHHTLADLGFPPLKVATAVEVLMGPEPEEFDPSAEDLADYHEWAAEVDRRWQDERMEDEDDLARWSSWQDALEAAHPPVREQDIRAAGLAI